MKGKIFILTLICTTLLFGCGSNNKDEEKPALPPVTPEPVTANIIEGHNTAIANDGISKNLYTSIFFIPDKPTDNTRIETGFSIEQPIIDEPVQDNGYYIPQAQRDISSELLYNQLRKNEYIINFSKTYNDYRKGTLPQEIKVGTVWQGINVLLHENPINAKCEAVSDNAYIFVEEGNTLTTEQLNRIKTDFEKIYVKNREIFGYDTDTDGHSKIILLFTKLDNNILGYFNSNDKVAESSLPTGSKSNEADMLYFNLNELSKENGLPNLLATLAHEYQHMIRFDYRKAKGLNTQLAPWVDEGLSMLAEYYNGYTHRLNPYLEHFIDNAYQLSLTNFTDINYGYSMAFFMYLDERFGRDFIRKLYDNEKTGVISVGESVDMDFNKLYQDFVYMILVSGRNINKDTRYNMKNLDIKSAVDKIYAKYGLGSYPDGDDTHTATTFYDTSFAPLHPYSFILVKWLNKVDEFIYTPNEPDKPQGYMTSF